jgi:hypothetical protein
VVVAGTPWGSVLAVTTLIALVAISVGVRDTALLVTASVATLFTVPAVMGLWFPGLLSAALALLVTGLLLVGAAVIVMRRRRSEVRTSRRDGTTDRTSAPDRSAPPAAR